MSEQQMMNLLAHTIVEAADKMGKGVDMMEHLGEAQSKIMMDAYNAHEQTEKE